MQWTNYSVARRVLGHELVTTEPRRPDGNYNMLGREHARIL